MSGSAGIVTFDYEIWFQLYPELSGPVASPQAVGQAQAQHFFYLACKFVNNTPASPVPVTDCYGNPVRAPILGLVTAHIATILGPNSTEAVGRVESATQGSVNVSLDMGPTTINSAWWLQTKYGAMAWQMLAPYRSFRYFPAPRPYLGVGRGYGFRGYQPT